MLFFFFSAISVALEIDILFFSNFISNLVNNISIIKCDVNNKIILRDLIDEIKGEKWLAKSYSLLNNNCQDFGAEIVRILKAKRINEEDKIRINEKKALPNCLIEALTKNEESFTINTLGRIPVFGLIFDIFVAKRLIKK